MHLILKERHEKVIRKFQRQEKIFHDKTIPDERALNILFEKIDKILEAREIKNRDEIYRNQGKLI